MDNKKEVHQGEILMLLVKRSKKDGVLIAQEMGINRSHLSRLYKSKSLTIKVRREAARVLGVSQEVFNVGLGYEMPPEPADRVGDDGEEYRSLAAEVERLKAENAKMAEDLLREREVNDDLRKTLLLIAGNKADE